MSQQTRCPWLVRSSADMLGANVVLMSRYSTDVRPLQADVRVSKGPDPDPIASFAGSRHLQKITAECVGGHRTGWSA
jgi:L-rhamnose isomerase/sugar isomerase